MPGLGHVTQPFQFNRSFPLRQSLMNTNDAPREQMRNNYEGLNVKIILVGRGHSSAHMHEAVGGGSSPNFLHPLF